MALSLIDIAAINGAGPNAIGYLEGAAVNAPEVMMLPARTISGTKFNALVRTARPASGFRNANEGIAEGKGEYEPREMQMKYIDAQLKIDVQVAASDDRGAAHVLDLEAAGAYQSNLINIGRQTWYGVNATRGDTKGFVGALGVVPSTLVVDAGGTTAGTASSVFLVKMAPDAVELFLSSSGSPLNIGAWTQQRVEDEDGDPYTAWVNAIQGFVGVSFLDPYCVGRIKKITADTGKTLTESLGYQLLSAFPSGKEPTHAVMTKRSREQLRASLVTDLNPTPANPTTFCGLPIVVTESLVNTEALTL